MFRRRKHFPPGALPFQELALPVRKGIGGIHVPRLFLKPARLGKRLRLGPMRIGGLLGAFLFLTPLGGQSLAYSYREEGFLLDRNLPKGRQVFFEGVDLWIGGAPHRPYVILGSEWAVQGVGCSRSASFSEAVRRVVREAKRMGAQGVILWWEEIGQCPYVSSWVPEEILYAQAFRYRLEAKRSR
jgi:hypothetical protein